MKIVHVIEGLERGGAEMMLYKLLSRMNRERFENRVVSLTPLIDLADRITELGTPVDSLGMRRGSPNPMGIFRLVKLLKECKPDIVQGWMYHGNLVGFLAAKLAGVPAVAWNIRCSPIVPKEVSFLTKVVFKMTSVCSARPQMILFNSQRSLNAHCSGGYKPRRSAVIPNGFDLERYRPNPSQAATLRKELSVPESTKLIGIVARYQVEKDHSTFLRAAALTARKRADINFVLVGKNITPENIELAALIEELQLVRRTHLLGLRDDIPEIMAGIDVLALSSSREGFPNVVGEAMAAAVPCVSTNVGDVEHLIGSTGKIVTPGNSPALAQAWEDILNMPPSDLAALGNAARARITTLFDIKLIAQRYEEFFEDLSRKS